MTRTRNEMRRSLSKQQHKKHQAEQKNENLVLLKRSCKAFGLLLMYIFLWTIIFYAIDECIDQDKRVKKNVDSNQKCSPNATNVTRRYPHEYIRLGIFTNHLCKFQLSELTKWCYYTVVNLLTISTSYKTIYSTWSQLVKIPFILIGSLLVAQVYGQMGYLCLNIINKQMSRLNGSMRHKQENNRFQLLLSAVFCLCLYIGICGVVTTMLTGENREFRFEPFYQWTMILLSISDENLLGNTDSHHFVALAAMLTMTGFILSSTCLAAFVNLKYDLLEQEPGAFEKDESKSLMLGWFV